MENSSAGPQGPCLRDVGPGLGSSLGERWSQSYLTAALPTCSGAERPREGESVF